MANKPTPKADEFFDEFEDELEQADDGILDLSRILEGADVQLGFRDRDGNFWGYANIQKWGLRHRNRFAQICRKLDELQNSTQPKPGDDAREVRLLDAAMGLITPDFPSEKYEELSRPEKAGILSHFLLKSMERDPLFSSQIYSRTGGRV